MIEAQIKNTIKKYKLCSKREKILVALSGGKDSAVTAYFLKKFGYKIEGIYIDLGMGVYSKRCLNAVKKLCDDLEIKLHVCDIKKEMGSSMCYIRSSVQAKKKLRNCAICGVIKKYILNKQARKLKADKIATGHHLDDISQTFLMNIFKGSLKLNANLKPMLDVKSEKFIPRIKPLFFVLENDVRKFSKQKKLAVVYETCPCRGISYRVEAMNFLENFSDADKKNLVRNIMAISKKEISEKMIYCDVCGEPARRKVCKVCELVS